MIAGRSAVTDSSSHAQAVSGVHILVTPQYTPDHVRSVLARLRDCRAHAEQQLGSSLLRYTNAACNTYNILFSSIASAKTKFTGSLTGMPNTQIWGRGEVISLGNFSRFSSDFPSKFSLGFPSDFSRDFPLDFPQDFPQEFPRDFHQVFLGISLRISLGISLGVYLGISLQISLEFPLEFPSEFLSGFPSGFPLGFSLELPSGSGKILPYIPPLVLIRIQYTPDHVRSVLARRSLTHPVMHTAQAVSGVHSVSGAVTQLVTSSTTQHKSQSPRHPFCTL